MNNKISLKLISMEDIKKANCNDIDHVMSIIEEALCSYKRGEILLPDKISQIFDEDNQNRINVMPATIKNYGEAGISGVKWVSVFPENPIQHFCPNVTGIIILSELSKGYPFAVMDGTYITAFRTACMGAVGARYLARQDSKKIGIIGAGEQARMHFITIKHEFKGIQTCYVASRTHSSEERFILSLQKSYPDVEFVSCDSNYRKASKDADIIVTAVSCQKPLLKADSIKKGAFYCHVGGWEDEYEVPLMANKIVCDSWEAVKHRTPTLSRLFKMGKLFDSDIYSDIVDIIDGTKAGRESEDEFIYFNSIGLGFIDVSIAFDFYCKVEEKGYGIDWEMKKTGILDI